MSRIVSQSLFALGVLALLSSLTPRRADAYYVCEAVRWSPGRGTTVPTNFRILLSTPWKAQWRSKYVQQNGKPLLWLKAKDHTVPLFVVEVLRDGGGQVLLAPRVPLAAHTRYQLDLGETPTKTALAIEKATKESPIRIDGDPALPFWTTGDGPDTQPPRWRSAPRASGVEQSEYGVACPQWNLRTYRTPVEDDYAPTLLRVTASTPQGAVVTYYDSPYQKQIGLGGTICDPVSLDRDEYRVDLTAVDLAGNETDAPGGTFSYEAPRRMAPGEPLFGQLAWRVALPFLSSFLIVYLWMWRRRRR